MAPTSTTVAPPSEARPGATDDSPTPSRHGLMAAVLVAAVGVWLAGMASGAIGGLSALWLVTGVAVPLAFVTVRPRMGTVGLGIVLVLAVGLPAQRVIDNIADPADGQLAAHDGGVIVTRAAAEDVVAGRNPYSQSFHDDLPEVWRDISVDGVEGFVNPIRSVYPYLPGAFLAMTPLAAVSGSDSLGDPRWVMLATFVAACVVIARRPEPPWARAAALSASSGLIVSIHLGYGTNDTWAASLFVLGALALDRRPRVAGVLLALAVSVKFLLLPPIALWLAWRFRVEGMAVLRRLWTLPATLVATCLPFLLWAPGDFLNDTLLFWLGRNDEPFPTSGFGLAAAASGVFHGPVLALATVACAVIGVVAAAAVVRRFAHPAALPPAAALVVLGLLVPARTFQGNYLAMIAGLLATGWLVVGARAADADAPARTVSASAPQGSTSGHG